MLLRIEQALNRIERLLAAGSLLLLLLIALGQIIARNLFDTGSIAADTLARHLVLYVVFFGAILAIRANEHIRIDLLAHFIPAQYNLPMNRAFQLVAATVCCLLCVGAVRFWISEWSFAPDYERWIFLVALILPIGFALMTFHFLLRAVNMHETR